LVTGLRDVLEPVRVTGTYLTRQHLKYALFSPRVERPCQRGLGVLALR